MATFTITTAQNIDALTAKAGGDVYNINGGTLTIDQDSRYGLNQTTSTSLGNITLSATLGGSLEVDARFVRIIAYTIGTGTVPASNTTISQGSASGLLIGVYSALNVAPTAAGAAMPASGFIKIKAWNSVAFASGLLTGILATSSGADVVGWIELVGDEAGLCTINRLNSFRMRGEWYDLGTTDGTRATTYQIPSNGTLQYHAGVWVETATSSGVYEFYACAGTMAALAANLATDALRGKYCWISTAGLLRFGHDGTNSTGGYIPPTGRKVRIPNIFCANCTTAARTANVLPNATLATRYEFATTGGGVFSEDKVSSSWYHNLNQPYSIALSNVGICTAMVVSEVAAPMTWNQVGIGQEAANVQTALTMTLCFAGGSFTDCTFGRVTQAGGYAVFYQDISGFTFTNNKFYTLTKASNAASGCATLLRVDSCTWNTPIMGAGRMLLTTVTNNTFTNSVYYDHPATTTTTAIPMYVWDLASSCSNIKMDGLNFGGLTLVAPYSGILNMAAAGCTNIKLRNIGTSASPLDLGGAKLNAKGWTRVTTTATVTSVAHGLKTNDIIYVNITSDTGAIIIGAKTITVTTADVFTFTCLNAGAASGTISYFPQYGANLFVLATGAAVNGLKVQRCYVAGTRTNLYSLDNSSKNITMESVYSDSYFNTPIAAMLNGYVKGVKARTSLAAQTSVYGVHFFDNYQDEITTNLSAQAWTRTTTTATVTSTDHGLVTGSLISCTVTSDAAAIVKGQKSITVLTKDTFTFTCLNAGGASGTLTFVPLNGRIGLLMNESTSDTSSQYTIDAGVAAFTSAGGLYMPNVNDQVTFTTPNYVLGHKNFPINVPVMAGGTIGNYDITYDIDRGSGFSGTFKNLSYPRAGGGGSSASTNVTMTSTTGVSAGDYVTGTNIAPNAKVSSITNSTTVVVDIANIGTVSGVLTFNQLPSEADIPSTGAKLKIRLKTTTTNATAITSLFAYTFSDSTFRAYQYPLDIVPIKVTVKDATTFALIQDARVYLTASGGGPQADGTILLTGLTDVSGIIQNISFEYLGNQSFTGRVRRGTSGTLYKTANTTGTITSSGLDLTVFLIADI